jgi:CheY-like chemotaxis protein
MATDGRQMSDAAEQQAAAGAIRARRMLVVDDDELSGAVQSQLLRLLGYETAVETDGDRAVERALGEGFDLLLVDLSMPRTDGFELLRRLRQREAAERRQPLPLVAVTGFTADQARERCRAAGFAGHVGKPVRLAELQRAIEDALGRATPTGPAYASDAERLRATAQRLGQLDRNEEGFAPTATEAFALRSAQLIDSLRRAIDAHDGTRAVHHLDALAACAEYLGASTLSAGATALRVLCGAGDWPQARRELTEFEHRHQAVLAVLFQIDR